MGIPIQFRFLTAAVAGICALASPVRGQAKPAKPVLPQAIATAFHQAYPKATIRAFNPEKKQGRVIYEIESRDGTTRRGLVYTLEGKILEIEEAVPPAALPAAVRSALEAAAPGATVSRAERVTRDTVVTYELSVRIGGKARVLEFDPAGRPVKP